MHWGNLRRSSKILQAEEISTGNEDFDCAQAQPGASHRSQVAAADGVSQRQVAVVLETVIATNMTLQKWSARAAIERWAARADCESVLSVTAAKSQYSAWRKSKRVLRLSVRRSRPEKGRSRRLIVSSAGTESELRFGPGIQGRGLAASPQHGEPFGASRVRSSCRHKSGKPEQRGASHDGRSAKDQL
jgi:hypothetical protein